ncbi:MAG: YggS family pyridoxal phosphate-dependent enzyme [Rhodospirillales bacterium]|nr:MAG: YggS family pyridoxal phosphate-dependent enzyme [Rhodospirillales bacterium]
MGVDIAANLASVKAEMAKAAEAAGRDPASVTLVAVSKTHGPEALRAAIAAGQRVFGENRVQEAEDKWPPLKQAVSDVRLHLLGPLQRNKVKRALELFDVIETLDRPALARTLAAALEQSDVRPDILIQINTGEEPQKHGILPKDADAFIRGCLDDLGLPIRGLMCIPPVDEEPALHFAFLHSIAERNGLGELSMGMTADYPTAIRFGATMVRVGTAIFGARPAVSG